MRRDDNSNRGKGGERGGHGHGDRGRGRGRGQNKGGDQEGTSPGGSFCSNYCKELNAPISKIKMQANFSFNHHFYWCISECAVLIDS